MFLALHVFTQQGCRGAGIHHLSVVTVNIRHHRIILVRFLEQMTEDQWKVRQFIIKTNS